MLKHVAWAGAMIGFNNMNRANTLVLSLIREHFDGTEDSFKEKCMDVAKYFDDIEKHALAEYVFAYVFPATAFSTFETIYYKGNVIKTTDSAGKEYTYEIVSVEDTGVYAKSLDKENYVAYFISYEILSKDYWMEK